MNKSGIIITVVATSLLLCGSALAETSQGGIQGITQGGTENIHVGGTKEVSSGGIQEVTTEGIPLLDKLLDQLRGIVAGNK